MHVITWAGLVMSVGGARDVHAITWAGLAVEGCSMQEPPDPLFTFRPHSGEVTSLKYVQLSDKESGIVSG